MARIYIVVVVTPLTGGRNAISSKNKKIIFKNLPILDERRPTKTAVRSGTLKLDEFPYRWLDMNKFSPPERGSILCTSEKKMFEDIQ